MKEQLLNNGYYYLFGNHGDVSWYKCKICHKRSHEEITMKNHVKQNHTEIELKQLPMELEL